MKTGIIQSYISLDKEENLKTAEERIKHAADEGAEIVVLSESFNCPYANHYFVEYAETADGESLSRMSVAAAKNGIYLIAGSIPLLEDGRIYNASFVFDRSGKAIACHKKVHLFDIDIRGGQRFKESDTFTAGDHITTFDTDFGKMGLCICFDFRFPELSRLMALEGAKCIFVPAAFNMTTGPAHWELLFRQRAVDDQVYTIGAAPARGTKGYISYANSIVADPWGTVIYRADEKPAAKVIDLDLSRIDDIREQLPLLSARRTDIYHIGKI